MIPGLPDVRGPDPKASATKAPDIGATGIGATGTGATAILAAVAGRATAEGTGRAATASAPVPDFGDVVEQGRTAPGRPVRAGPLHAGGEGGLIAARTTAGRALSAALTAHAGSEAEAPSVAASPAAVSPAAVSPAAVSATAVSATAVSAIAVSTATASPVPATASPTAPSPDPEPEPAVRIAAEPAKQGDADRVPDARTQGVLIPVIAKPERPVVETGVAPRRAMPLAAPEGIPARDEAGPADPARELPREGAVRPSIDRPTVQAPVREDRPARDVPFGFADGIDGGDAYREPPLRRTGEPATEPFPMQAPFADVPPEKVAPVEAAALPLQTPRAATPAPDAVPAEIEGRVPDGDDTAPRMPDVENAAPRVRVADAGTVPVADARAMPEAGTAPIAPSPPAPAQAEERPARSRDAASAAPSAPARAEEAPARPRDAASAMSQEPSPVRTGDDAPRPRDAAPVIPSAPAPMRAEERPSRSRDAVPVDGVAPARPLASPERYAPRPVAPRDGSAPLRAGPVEGDPYSIAATMNEPVTAAEAAQALAAASPVSAATPQAPTGAAPAQAVAMAPAPPLAMAIPAAMQEASPATVSDGMVDPGGDSPLAPLTRGEASADVRHVATPLRPATTDGADALQEIVRAAVVTKGPTTIELRLDPSELGRIDIELSFVDDRVSIMVRGEREDALDLMRRSSDELGRMLRQAGLDLDTLGFARDQSGERGREQAFRAFAVEGAGENAGAEGGLAQSALRLGPAPDRVDIRI